MSDARAASAMDHALGRKLRTARMGAGLSQQALADRLGITFQQVQKYEKGANRIAASRLVSIAGALNQPISYFLTEGKAAARGAGAAKPDQASAASFFASIENPKVRRRVVDLLRAIIAADAARRAQAPRPQAPRPKAKARGKTRAVRSRAI